MITFLIPPRGLFNALAACPLVLSVDPDAEADAALGCALPWPLLPDSDDAEAALPTLACTSNTRRQAAFA